MHAIKLAILVAVGATSMLYSNALGQEEKPPTYPAVVLSDEHKEQVLVGVGQTLPEIQLPPVGGKEPETLSSLYGEGGTVVVWFAELDSQTKTMLRDLPVDVVEPYTKRNLKVIAIAVGEAPEMEAVRELGFTGPVHHDKDTAAFLSVGTELLPRVYLLDPAGKVLWLDIEYSQSTRRELGKSLQILLPSE